MPSSTYHLLAQAMAERQQVLCSYDGLERELCPTVLGHSKGEETLLAYQFGGASSGRLPPGGQWRCLKVAKIKDARLRQGPWRAGSSHTAPQGCVEIVDFDVNSDSPYQPKRGL